MQPAPRRAAERHDPTHGPIGRAYHDEAPGPDLADDPCNGTVHRFSRFAAGHAPATAPVEQQLPVDDPGAGRRLG